MIERKPNPTDAKTYYQLGNDYYEKSDYEKAIENYNMAILLNPVFSEAYFNRALSYYQLKNFDKSVADYTKAGELDPQNPIIYNNRGDAFYRKQDFQTAVKDYDKAITLNPNYLKAFYNRGLSYASIEEYEKAVEDFSKVIQIKADFAEAYHLRGLAHEYAGSISDAITDYEKALQLNPELAEAKTHLESAKAKKEQEGKGEGGAGGAAGADIKMLQKPNMTFTDVAGMKKMKEEIREAIVYPMMNPDLARKYGKLGGGGILMYGPPGCGKCMAGDTPVLLENGRITNIIDIYEDAERRHHAVKNEHESIIENPGVRILSLNKETLKVEPKDVTHVYRQRYKGKVYEITTWSGRQVTVTPEHPFIAISDGALKRKAAELSIGDHVAVPRTVSTKSVKSIGIVPDGFRQFDGMVQYISNRHPHTRAIRQIAEVDGEMGRFFGCMLSEGASIYGTMYFSNSDQRLIDDVARISGSRFGIEPRVKPDTSPGVQKVEIGSVTLMRFLEQAFDFKLRGSRNARIPSSVLQSDDSVATQFLSAVFECEASVRKDVPEVEFSTSSKEFVNGIAYMLLRFGIVARIKPKMIKGNDHVYWRLYISSDGNLKRFEQRIGFISGRKRDALANWTGRGEVENTNTDVIPNIATLLKEARETAGLDKNRFYLSKNGYRYESGKNLSRDYLAKILAALPSGAEKLRVLAESDVLWDEITDIKEKEIDGYVYDLTVCGNHTFIAGFGGIVVHNTFIVKAAAGECQAGFINAKLSDLLDMYVGNTEKNIHKVFELARKHVPCILFFDEVDALGGRRDQQEGQQYMKMAVNQLLYEMDGVEANNQNVLVIAATNAPWDVDPALRRSGRFSKLLYIPEPDYDSRVAILKMHAKKRPLTSLIPFTLLGAATMGYASADLKAVVDEAATYPWREAFFGIEKKAEKYIQEGMTKDEAHEKAKGEVYQRPLSVGDFMKGMMKKKSSLPPWYGQAKKQIGKQEEITIIDGKEHKKLSDSKMGPAEKESFKDLLGVINARNQAWQKFLIYGVVRYVTLALLFFYTLVLDKKIVLSSK
jgi:SpoVK/Ycf46/Vps4 family AAA+-type ATPase/intein/homing endonuclease